MTRIAWAEFPPFANLVREATGIELDRSKAYLIETRLSPLLARSGAASFGELLQRIRSDGSGELRRSMIDLITTQETSFFRDTSPFEMLKNKMLPDLVDARSSARPKGARIPLRIWSAACATGQEVYSIAIALAETLGDLGRFDIRLLGTDISDSAIAAASRGHYTEAELDRGMSAQRLAAHFSRDQDGYRVRDELRALASFKRQNLHEDFLALGTWDIVFCRNIAIYFSDAAKKSLFERLGRALASDGCLVIGSTESLVGLCPQYEPMRYLRSVFYRKTKRLSAGVSPGSR
jgi:chemotaxis protein methyltransferase CheR